MRLITTDYLPVEWIGERVRILDQTRLPQEEVYLELDDYRSVAAAISEMKVRGAPAIGVIGAYGIALGALGIEVESRDKFLVRLGVVFQTIAATREKRIRFQRVYSKTFETRRPVAGDIPPVCSVVFCHEPVVRAGAADGHTGFGGMGNNLVGPRKTETLAGFLPRDTPVATSEYSSPLSL